MTVQSYSIDRVVDSILHLLIGQTGPEEELDREVRWSLQGAQLLLYHEILPHAFRDAFTVTTQTGVELYDLPDDFGQVIEDTVRFTASDFRTLREIPLQMFHRYQLNANQSSGDPVDYRVTHKDKADGVWQLFLHPTPDTDTREVVGDYRCLPKPIWNSTRGSGETFDNRWTQKDIHVIECGALCLGKWTRYLNGVDITVQAKTWAEGIATGKKNNNPVVGRNSQRQPYTGSATNRVRGYGVMPSWWGGSVSGPTANS